MRADRWPSNSTCLLIIATIAGYVSLAPRVVHAFSNGITGFSGRQQGIICNSCHAAGTAPTVNFDGPTTVAPGSVNTYMFTVQSQAAAQTHAGLDLSVTAGTFAVDSAQGAKILVGEIVHTEPKANTDGMAAWEFSWTAPSAPGAVTMFGAGNSVNGDDSTFGDRATATTLTIMVAPAGDTPTPSPTPTVPLGNSPTPTATSGPIPCVGDCDDSGAVAVNELVTGVNIALDRAEISACPSFDRDNSQTVSVNELVSGVNALLRGCSPEL